MILFIFTIFSINDVGSTAFPLLKIGIGPRPAALGEAYIGLPRGASSIWWNPAGLATDGLELEASHQEWFGGFRDEVIGVNLANGLGIGLLHSSCGEIEVWDPNNYPGSTPLTSVATEYLNLGYGGRLGKRFSYGFGTKMLYERAYDDHQFAFGADLGLIYYNTGYGFGVTVNHLSPKFYYGNQKVILPISISLGGLYDRIKNLNLLTAINLPVDNRPIFRFGMEYIILDRIAVRLGYRTGPQDLEHLGLLSGLTSGIGVKIDQFRIDYCFVPYGELGLTHRIGIGMNIPYGSNDLRVKVYDTDLQKPIPARLQITGAIEDDQMTDEIGRYQTRIKKSGWVYFTASAEGYFPQVDSTYLFGDRDQEFVLYLKEIGQGMIYGHLYDAFTKEPIEGRITYDGPVTGKVKTSGHGSFKIINLPKGPYELTGYDLYDSYMPNSVDVEVEAGVMKSCEIFLVKKKAPIVLKNINFETAKADLTPEAKVILDEIGRVIKENPELKVEISGHTDSREIQTAEFKDNWELSIARANAVKEYLVKVCEIDHRRLLTQGFADTKPIGPNTTEEGMAQNRRVEFRIVE